jgi:NAD(P)-dependent dehydrogenase (short-subunit alcohol dehydrogenase family)
LSAPWRRLRKSPFSFSCELNSLINVLNSPEEDLATFQTNVLGTLNVSKAFLPHIRATTGHRTLANFGSIASWGGYAGCALYSGTKWAVSGITEGMRAELAPLGIQATIIEPGYFRTGFLNTGGQVASEKQIQCYQDSAAGETRRLLGGFGGQQPGDVEKGAKVVVDVLMMEGVAKGREVPMRVALGSDSSPYIAGKCRDTLALLEEWNGVTMDTNHDDV